MTTPSPSTADPAIRSRRTIVDIGGTPLRVVINSSTRPFGAGGEVLDANVGEQLMLLGDQVAAFAHVSLAAAP